MDSTPSKMRGARKDPNPVVVVKGMPYETVASKAGDWGCITSMETERIGIHSLGEKNKASWGSVEIEDPKR